MVKNIFATKDGFGQLIKHNIPTKIDEARLVMFWRRSSACEEKLCIILLLNPVVDQDVTSYLLSEASPFCSSIRSCVHDAPRAVLISKDETALSMC